MGEKEEELNQFEKKIKQLKASLAKSSSRGDFIIDQTHQRGETKNRKGISQLNFRSMQGQELTQYMKMSIRKNKFQRRMGKTDFWMAIRKMLKVIS